jgi:hypothetical protein
MNDEIYSSSRVGLFFYWQNIMPNKEIKKYNDFGGSQFSELRGKKSPDSFTWFSVCI